MKKLITLIGAAATAFGLYAVDVDQNGINFNEVGLGVFDFPSESGQLFWYQTNTFGDVSGIVTNGTSNKYLLLDTDTNIVYRTAAEVGGDYDDTAQQVDVGTGVYFNQKVKFSVFEEDPTDLGDAKLAVWLKADAGATNLYVSTARLAIGGAPDVMTNLVLRGENGLPLNLNPDTFYQLKITAMTAYSTGTPVIGFAIEIDGAVCKVSDALWPEAAPTMTVAASKLIKEGKLFPSRMNSDLGFTTLMGVGYQGTGAIESIAIDAENDFEFNATITPPANTTIVGIRSTNNYEYVHNGDGTWTVAKGDAIEVTLAPVAGYTVSPTSKVFDNVTTATDFTDFSGITVSKETYSVRFMVGETQFAVSNVEYQAYTAAPNPAPEATAGQSFAGWFDTNSVPAGVLFDFANTQITNSFDLVAQFTNNQYTATFAAGAHNTVAVNPQKDTYQYNEKITVVVTAEANYEFKNDSYLGWEKVSNTVLSNDFTVTSNISEICPDAEEASPETPEVEPGGSVVVDASKTNSVEIAVPAAVTNAVDAAYWDGYKAMFTKKVTKIGDDQYQVTAELSEAASNEVQVAVDTANTNTLACVLAAAPGATTNVTVQTKPGLYYQIVVGTELPLTPSTDANDWTMATAPTLNLGVSKPSAGNAAFFRVYGTDVLPTPPDPVTP